MSPSELTIPRARFQTVINKLNRWKKQLEDDIETMDITKELAYAQEAFAKARDDADKKLVELYAEEPDHATDYNTLMNLVEDVIAEITRILRAVEKERKEAESQRIARVAATARRVQLSQVRTRVDEASAELLSLPSVPLVEEAARFMPKISRILEQTLEDQHALQFLASHEDVANACVPLADEIRALLKNAYDRKDAMASLAPPPQSTSSSSHGSEPRSPIAGRFVQHEKLKYPIFSGQSEAYLAWKRQWKIIVDSPNQLTEEQKVYVLVNTCLPKSLSHHCRAYKDTKDVFRDLDARFLAPGVLEANFTKTVSGFGLISQADPKKFIEFVDTVDQMVRDLQDLDQTTFLQQPVVTHRITAAVSAHNSIACSIALLREQLNEDYGKILPEVLKEIRRYRTLCYELESYYREFEAAKKKNGRDVMDKPASSSGRNKLGGSTLAGALAGPPSTFKCPFSSCTESKKHRLAYCNAYLSATVDERGETVVQQKLCTKCLYPGHMRKDCRKLTVWPACSINSCGGHHHESLHGCTVKGVVLSTVAGTGSEGARCIQAVPIAVEKPFQAKTIFDGGSTISLVRHDIAKKLRLQSRPVLLELTGIVGAADVSNTRLYTVPLVDMNGRVFKVNAFGVDEIPGQGTPIDAAAFAADLQVPVHMIEQPQGPFQLLIGQEVGYLMPKQIRQNRGRILYQSLFGSGVCVSGAWNPLLMEDPYKNTTRASTLAVIKSGDAAVNLDFFMLEALGISATPKCKRCLHCSECKFLTSQLSQIEALELRRIEAGLHLDLKGRQWYLNYAFKESATVLPDNYGQAVQMAERLEKRLVKNSQLDLFNQQFEDAVKRGVYVRMTDEELRDYSGTVHYTVLTETFKESATTPIRLCSNSSIKFRGISFNGLLVKGPPALNPLLNVLLNWRNYRCAVACDLSKFYNTVNISAQDQNLQRVVWRYGQQSEKFSVFKTAKLNFGIVNAGVSTTACLRKTAGLSADVYPVEVEKLIRDGFVDDNLSGADSRDDVQLLIDRWNIIVAAGGFSFKSFTVTGDTVDPQKVLGIIWSPATDELRVPFDVNLTPKIKGVKLDKNLDLDLLAAAGGAAGDNVDVNRCLNLSVVTKRQLLRVSAGFFDPMGLISPFTIKFKILYRSSIVHCPEAQWDDPLPERFRNEFVSLLVECAELKSLCFNRCFRPLGVADGCQPELVTFVDASQVAMSTFVYIRYPHPDGSAMSSLVTAKTRLAPLQKQSVPRLELIAAVLGVRLAETVAEATRIQFLRRFFLTDSTAVLSMISSQSGIFGEFAGNRVSEIQSKTNVPDDWFHVPTDHNIADIGTRGAVKIEALAQGSAYQCGPVWLAAPADEWPVSRKRGDVPAEELIPAARSVMAGSAKVQVTIETGLTFKNFHSAKKVIRIFSYVLKFVHKCLKVCKKIAPNDEPDFKGLAELYLIKSEQNELVEKFKKGHLDSLRPCLSEFQFLSQKLSLIVCSGRFDNMLSVGFDKSELPLLDSKSDFARLLMNDAHDFAHRGPMKTLDFSRKDVWIIKGSLLAKSVCANCFTCKRLNASLLSQQMAKLPEVRVQPSPAFANTAVDIAGPFDVYDHVKRRTCRKVYVLIFVCMYSTAVHTEILGDYSAKSVKEAFLAFISLRGCPAQVYSDQGSQLVCAAKDCAVWSGSSQLVWKFFAAQGQHQNGLAEKMVHLLKKVLLPCLENKKFEVFEFQTVLKMMTAKLNARPLSAKPSEDPESGSCLTPNHFLLGRSTPTESLLDVDWDAPQKKRAQFVQDLQEQFWKKFTIRVLPQLLASYKWKRPQRNLQVGDVVYISDASLLSKQFVLGRVVAVSAGKDNLVRSATVSYALPGNGGPRVTCVDRPVSKLALLVPAE